MARFIKKPTEVEACQLTLSDEMFYEWARKVGFTNFQFSMGDCLLLIHTLEGTLYVNENDWIIRGVAGEFYPCKPDIFKKTYDPL